MRNLTLRLMHAKKSWAMATRKRPQLLSYSVTSVGGRSCLKRREPYIAILSLSSLLMSLPSSEGTRASTRAATIGLVGDIGTGDKMFVGLVGDRGTVAMGGHDRVGVCGRGGEDMLERFW